MCSAQIVLPQPQHEGKACSSERALCSLLLSKDFKSSLVKRKKGSTMKSLPSVQNILLKKKKKTQKGMKKKKNLFSAFDLFLGSSIPPALWDDAVCQIPTAPASALSVHPTQSPSCLRQLASTPHMLTASPPGREDGSPFGDALLLLEQGSKALGGQAVVGS